MTNRIFWTEFGRGAAHALVRLLFVGPMTVLVWWLLGWPSLIDITAAFQRCIDAI